jgi:Kdo2-lipid IVA lauroyltransferase/acyltransferase
MWNDFLYNLTRGVFHILGRLPASVSNPCAVLLGRLFFIVDFHHRRVAIDNLRRAFGTQLTDKEIRALAARVFENLCRILFELAWVLRLPENQWPRFFRLSGITNYEAAAAQGRGVLMLVAHFGNWELLPVVAHLARAKPRIVYRPLDASFLDRFIRENRARYGAVMIPTLRGAMQKMYLALRRGNPVAMLIDQNEVLHKGVFADFFGHPACTNASMALLSLRSGAPVVPVFLIRQEDGKFRVEFGPAVYPLRTGDKTKDVEENTQRYNHIIETYVRRYPDQWFWVHQRWKTPHMRAWPDPIRRARWMKAQQRGTRK